MTLNNKSDVVNLLVKNWNCEKSSFYNTSTNQQREKFWTFNRCLRTLWKYEENYYIDEHGNRSHNSLKHI